MTRAASLERQTVSLPQTVETPTTTILHSNYRVRYTFARSSESQRLEVAGQDYLTLRHSDERVAFVLCDGVGQSYHGNLAAAFVGEHLLNWLWVEMVEIKTDERILRNALATYLNELTPEASTFIGAHTASEKSTPTSNADEIVREAREQLRAIGSETTFSGAYIEFPGDRFPDGLLVLTWLGDSPIRIWGANGERTGDIASYFQSGDHWSSRDGLKTEAPYLLKTSLPNVRRVMAYSDGFLPLQSKLHKQLEPHQLDRFVYQLQSAGYSDDLSLIDVQLGEFEPDAEAKRRETQAATSSVIEERGQIPGPTVQQRPVPVQTQSPIARDYFFLGLAMLALVFGLIAGWMLRDRVEFDPPAIFEPVEERPPPLEEPPGSTEDGDENRGSMLPAGGAERSQITANFSSVVKGKGQQDGPLLALLLKRQKT